MYLTRGISLLCTYYVPRVETSVHLLTVYLVASTHPSTYYALQLTMHRSTAWHRPWRARETGAGSGFGSGTPRMVSLHYVCTPRGSSLPPNGTEAAAHTVMRAAAPSRVRREACYRRATGVLEACTPHRRAGRQPPGGGCGWRAMRVQAARCGGGGRGEVGGAARQAATAADLRHGCECTVHCIVSTQCIT